MEQEASAERDEIAAKAAAEVAKIQAEADAEVMKIQADAAEYAGQRDAAINKALSDTLTEVLIKYYEIQRWDGKLPEYFVSGTAGVLPSLGSLPTDGATEYQKNGLKTYLQPTVARFQAVVGSVFVLLVVE